MRAARSETGRKAIQQGAAVAAAFVAKSGGKRYGQWRADHSQRMLAHRLARQVHGELSEGVFVDSPRAHLIVWKDGVPLAAFPPVEGELAQRLELRHVTDADRFEPPPAPRRR